MARSRIWFSHREKLNALICRIGIFLTATFGFFALQSCSIDRETELRIAFAEEPQSQTIRLVKDKGFDREFNLNLVLSPTTSAPEAMRLFKNEVVDIAALGLHNVIPLAKSHDLTIIGMLGKPTSGRTLISRPEIKTLYDLDNSSIGTHKGDRKFIADALNEVGLSLDDVELIYTPYVDGETWLAEGRIDAFVSTEPQITRLKRLGMNILFDRTHSIQKPFFVLVARSDFADQNRKALDALDDSWKAANDYTSLHPQEVASLLAPKIGLSATEFQLLMDGFETNEDYLNGESYDVRAELDRLKDIFVREGISRADSGASIISLYWEK